MASAAATHRAWAEAIFELARDTSSDELERVEGELAAFAKLLTDEPQIMSVFKSPKVAVEVKQELVKKAVDGRFSKLLVNALLVMAQKRRLAELPGVAGAFQALVDAHVGRQRVVVSTAVEMDDETRSQVKGAIAEQIAKQVILEEKVDPALIGGLVFTYGDTRVDGSVRRRLQLFRNKLRGKVRAPVG